MRYLLILLLLLNLSYTKETNSSKTLQQNDNLVNWMEWGESAFNKAKDNNRFIFLSIVHKGCQKCQLMAKESYSQKDVANILNEKFVTIKVDKDKLDEVNSYYQMGYQLINNSKAGWPLIVILLPNKKPVYFGKYMPKYDFVRLLNRIITSKRDKLEEIAKEIDLVLKSYQKEKIKNRTIETSLLQKAFEGYKKSFDNNNSIAKMPDPCTIEELLNIYLIKDNKEALKIATNILDAIAKSKMYDQIDGAFFENDFKKSLYTNAKFLSLYAKAYRLTKSKLYEKVIRETIKEIDKHFLEHGLYYSFSAANKNFYLFSYNEAYNYLIKKGISKVRTKEVLHYFGIEPYGNYKDTVNSVPYLSKYNPIFKREQHLLSELRAKKESPSIDKKIITSWNALYIKAKIDASIVDRSFAKEAISSLHKLLESMQDKKGNLYHSLTNDNKLNGKATIEDYLYISDALFVAYQVTLDDIYLQQFTDFVNLSVNKFYKDDNWIESSSIDKNILGANLQNLLKAVAFGDNKKLLEIVDSGIKLYAKSINKAPHLYPKMLDAITIREKGIYIIRGPKLGLIKENLNDIKYPFVYKKGETAKTVKEYQLCTLQKCIYKDISIMKIKKELQKVISKSKTNNQKSNNNIVMLNSIKKG